VVLVTLLQHRQAKETTAAHHHPVRLHMAEVVAVAQELSATMALEVLAVMAETEPHQLFLVHL
jgi:hypothetical protein